MSKCKQFALIGLMCLAVIAIGMPAWGQNTIKIGIIGPMEFTHGQGQWNGAVMAADEINARGGVQVGNRKMRIELVKADSNEFRSVEDAVKAMETLVRREKVNFVVGGFRSEAVLAMQDVAMDAKTIYMGVGAVHPELCDRVVRDYDRYKYWFRSTQFNSDNMAKTLLIQLRTVASLMRSTLGIDRLKVAILAEKAIWNEAMISAAESYIPRMTMDVTGVWRPAQLATDLSTELSEIQRSGAHIILTFFSTPVGVAFARQAGQLKIPAAVVGVNTEAQKEGFWEATQGGANYHMTLANFARGAEVNELTRPFVEGYIQRFGELPVETAGTHSVINYLIVPAVEATGSLDADRVIKYLEDNVHKGTTGNVAFMRNEQGRHTHDLVWGPGYLTALAMQWQNGKQVPVWPHFRWISPQWEFSAEPPATPHEMSYRGIQPVAIAPWVITAHKR